MPNADPMEFRRDVAQVACNRGTGVTREKIQGTSRVGL